MTRPATDVRDISHAHRQANHGARRPAALSLDAAGTVLDLAEPVASTYARIASAHGIDATPAQVSGRFAEAFAGAPPMAFGPVAPDRLDRLERDWWREVVRACLGLRRDDARLSPCFDALYEWYAQTRAWRLYDDVLPTLDMLREAGIPVVVLSNFDSRLLAVAEGLGLAARVTDVLFSTALGYAKPDARAFAAAAQALGVPAQEVLHVGDSRDADVEGARAAGCQALLLDRGGEPSAGTEPDPGTIVSLSSLAHAGMFSRAS